MAPAQYKYLRQGLSITGLGSPTFEQALETAQSLYAKFECQLPPGKLDNWGATMHEEHTALDISNRYLTPKKESPSATHIPFTKAIDPYGILEGMVKSEYVHGEDNEVYYYACRTENGDDR